MFDLSKVRVNSDVPQEMAILNPVDMTPFADEDGNVAALLVLGPDSEVYQRKQKEHTNKLLRNAQQRGGSAKVTAEQVEMNRLEMLTAVIVGFKNLALNGETLEFSSQNARMILKDYPFIREQLEVFLSEAGNFIAVTSKISSSTAENTSI